MRSRVSLLLLLCAGLIGCAGRIVPERFMTVGQAFDPAGGYMPPAEFSDAMKKGIFSAPYEDVFRAVEVSASQAQFNVESENKSAGLILATRVLNIPVRLDYVNRTDPAMHTFFYAISLKELGPRKTEVAIAARVQGRCMVGNKAGLSVMTLGMAAGASHTWEKNCFMLSGGMWASGPYMQSEEFNQFMIFVRNNLIAAGVL